MKPEVGHGSLVPTLFPTWFLAAYMTFEPRMKSWAGPENEARAMVHHMWAKNDLRRKEFSSQSAHL